MLYPQNITNTQKVVVFLSDITIEKKNNSVPTPPVEPSSSENPSSMKRKGNLMDWESASKRQKHGKLYYRVHNNMYMCAY